MSTAYRGGGGGVQEGRCARSYQCSHWTNISFAILKIEYLARPNSLLWPNSTGLWQYEETRNTEN